MPIHDWSPVHANLFHDFHQSWAVRIAEHLNCGPLPRGYSALLERSGTPPETSTDAQSTLAEYANRISIRHRLTRVVCVIEIVSPGNKSGRASLRSFVRKSIEFLQAGIHLLIVDLFPPSVRDPAGIHKAIWDEIEERPFALPADQPLTLAAYVASQPCLAYVEPVGVGEAMPDMPAYLTEDPRSTLNDTDHRPYPELVTALRVEPT